MKKVISYIFIFVMVIVLSGCTSNKSGINEKKVDLNNTSSIKLNKLNFVMPNDFEKSKESSDTILFYDLPLTENVKYDLSGCSMMINVTKAYNDDEEDTIEYEIKREHLNEYFEQDYKIEKKKLNAIEWTYAKVKSKLSENNSYYIEYVYVVDYQGNRYSFELTEYGAGKNRCDNLISKVTNSFKFDE